jgi:hypothetical protein
MKLLRNPDRWYENAYFYAIVIVALFGLMLVAIFSFTATRI